MKTPLYLLNSPVLTNYGDFRLAGPLNLSQVQELLADGFVSAIGHAGTADLLSVLLGLPVPVVRQRVALKPGERALVLRLTTRLPEGRILSADDLAQIPYEFALLTSLA